MPFEGKKKRLSEPFFSEARGHSLHNGSTAPLYSSANHSPRLGPAGLEHKAPSYQREHL